MLSTDIYESTVQGPRLTEGTDKCWRVRGCDLAFVGYEGALRWLRRHERNGNARCGDVIRRRERERVVELAAEVSDG